MNNKYFDWLDERYKLHSLTDYMSKKSVPVNKHTVWYYFGGISLFLFIVQIVTGMLLLLYYKPGENASFESVKFIMSKVSFGWLIRSIHSWSANLMILTVFIHMFSVFFTKAYRKPRELTWISGFILLLLALVLGFSGYLLPWNELSFFATKVGTDMIGSIPGFGPQLMEIVRGGPDVTGSTLTRFFGLHVSILPLIFIIILSFHLIVIQIQGMSDPVEKSKKTMPFFPNFIIRDLLLWLVVLNILAILAVFFPMELGKKADAFTSAPAGIKPEWYFLFMFQTLKFIPSQVLFLEGEFFGILMFSLAGILWFLIPFWDIKTKNGYRNRLVNIIGLTVVIFIIIMTIIGHFT